MPRGTLRGKKERQGASESHAASLSRAFWGLPNALFALDPAFYRCSNTSNAPIMLLCSHAPLPGAWLHGSTHMIGAGGRHMLWRDLRTFLDSWRLTQLCLVRA